MRLCQTICFNSHEVEEDDMDEQQRIQLTEAMLTKLTDVWQRRSIGFRFIKPKEKNHAERNPTQNKS